MLAIISKTKALKNLAALILCTALFSFSSGSGGEGFEIYLNNKVVLQQFGNNMNTVKTLKLDQAAPMTKYLSGIIIAAGLARTGYLRLKMNRIKY